MDKEVGQQQNIVGAFWSDKTTVFFFHVKNIVRASDWPRLVLQCLFSDYLRGFLSFLSSNEVQQSRIHKASVEEKE